MKRDTPDLLMSGMLGVASAPPARRNAVERELHAIASSTGRMANALERIAPSLESIAKNIAALCELVERSSR